MMRKIDIKKLEEAIEKLLLQNPPRHVIIDLDYLINILMDEKLYANLSFMNREEAREFILKLPFVVEIEND